MKADYKNWVPKGLIIGLFIGAAVCLCLLLVNEMSGLIPSVLLKTVFNIVFLVGMIGFSLLGIWMLMLNRRFSYDGNRQMAKQIIEGVAEYIDIPDGGRGLDIGCGSGALAIACAKRNPQALIVGIDRWGKEYSSFSEALCKHNAKAEGVNNITFTRGDALKLEFEDESFDAVCSNYVYHNIPSRDRQTILLETLRTLKKGGIFALHDIFSQARYGDMQTFIDKLKAMGYSEVELIDTTNGKFMSKSESLWMGLSGSALLVGRK